MALLSVSHSTYFIRQFLVIVPFVGYYFGKIVCIGDNYVYQNIVIIVQGKYVHTVREIMQEALNIVVKWADEEGLNISPHKTAIVPFTNRRKTEGLGPLILHGKELEMLGEV